MMSIFHWNVIILYLVFFISESTSNTKIRRRVYEKQKNDFSSGKQGYKRGNLDSLRSKTLTKKEEEVLQRTEKVQEKHTIESMAKLHEIKKQLHEEISYIANDREQKEILAKLNNERKHELDMEKEKKSSGGESRDLDENDKAELKLIDESADKSVEKINLNISTPSQAKKQDLSKHRNSLSKWKTLNLATLEARSKTRKQPETLKQQHILASYDAIYPLSAQRREHLLHPTLSSLLPIISEDYDMSKTNNQFNVQKGPTVFSSVDTDSLGSKRSYRIHADKDINRKKFNDVMSFYKNTHKDLNYRSYIPKHRYKSYIPKQRWNRSLKMREKTRARKPKRKKHHPETAMVRQIIQDQNQPTSIASNPDSDERNIDINLVLPKQQMAQSSNKENLFQPLLTSSYPQQVQQQIPSSNQVQLGTPNQLQANVPQLPLPSVSFPSIPSYPVTTSNDGAVTHMVSDLTRALDRQQMSSEVQQMTNTLAQTMLNTLILTGHHGEHHDGNYFATDRLQQGGIMPSNPGSKIDLPNGLLEMKNSNTNVYDQIVQDAAKVFVKEMKGKENNKNTSEEEGVLQEILKELRRKEPQPTAAASVVIEKDEGPTSAPVVIVQSSPAPEVPTTIVEEPNVAVPPVVAAAPPAVIAPPPVVQAPVAAPPPVVAAPPPAAAPPVVAAPPPAAAPPVVAAPPPPAAPPPVVAAPPPAVAPPVAAAPAAAPPAVAAPPIGTPAAAPAAAAPQLPPSPGAAGLAPPPPPGAPPAQSYPPTPAPVQPPQPQNRRKKKRRKRKRPTASPVTDPQPLEPQTPPTLPPPTESLSTAGVPNRPPGWPIDKKDITSSDTSNREKRGKNEQHSDVSNDVIKHIVDKALRKAARKLGMTRHHRKRRRDKRCCAKTVYETVRCAFLKLCRRAPLAVQY